MKKNNYNTKQRQIILNFIKNNNNEHLNIDDINTYLKKSGYNIGKTTIYRFLELLVEKGEVRKFFIKNGQPACYQYINNFKKCDTHYHLKCTECNNLLHMDCDYFNDVDTHIMEEHGFVIDKSKVVLYGKCERCVMEDER
ncbi:MAG TPA: transcriptional repressor [Tenericutes bacterium]|nr:transcriptional repressor [Mycoplasmatota bacterium]